MKHRASEHRYPPDVFWIKDDGTVMEVVGHYTAMQADPEAFGLHAAPHSKREIDEAFEALFDMGWVRGRMDGATLHVQMGRPRGRCLAAILAFILKYPPGQIEWVNVDFADVRFARASKEISAEDFVDQKFPGMWLENPRRSRR